MRRELEGPIALACREVLFRATCRHCQGANPNILMHCTPRSGSTWLLNTIASHPGMRYVGRPFQTAMKSRWRKELPDLNRVAGYVGDYKMWAFVHFEGEDERRFRQFARKIVHAERHIYPTLNFRGSYFNRVTDRVLFQITHATAMAEWFDEHCDIDTLILLRHPIPNALSFMTLGWKHECLDFLQHGWFVDTQLTGNQVDFTKTILDEGSDLAKTVLDCTLRMLLPFRALESGSHPDWQAITYEQMVLEPEVVIDTISRQFNLPDTGVMIAQSRQISRTAPNTAKGKEKDKAFLLERWHKKVSPSEEKALMQIPARLGLDVYSVGRSLPDQRYMHGGDTSPSLPANGGRHSAA